MQFQGSRLYPPWYAIHAFSMGLIPLTGARATPALTLSKPQLLLAPFFSFGLPIIMILGKAPQFCAVHRVRVSVGQGQGNRF